MVVFSRLLPTAAKCDMHGGATLRLFQRVMAALALRAVQSKGMGTLFKLERHLMRSQDDSLHY